VERDPELAAIVACSLIESGAAQPHLEAPALDAEETTGCSRALAESRALARLYLARLRGDARDALVAADGLLAGTGPREGSRRALLHANLGRTALWAGDVDRAARELEAAVAIGRARGLDHLLVGALGQLALLNVSRHGPDLARPLTEEALALADRRGWADSPETAAAQLAAAATALYAHRLDAAEEHLQAARAALHGSHDVHLAAVARHLGALLAEARGELQQGLEGLGAAAGDVRGWGLADPGMLLATQARLLLASGDGFEAKRALHHAQSAPGGALQAGFARIHLAEGDAYAALATLSEARPELAVTRVDLLLLESLAFELLGRADVGTAFEATLTAAESTGVKAPLAQAGAAIRPRLLEAIRHGTAHRSVVGELLDVLDERVPLEAAASAIDPLSGREQAVLRYLPTTLSNREIAVELLVSTNTLKTHLRAIYRKLDVGDRRDAVRRARSLGLLAGHRIAG
jgi:LuxR family maltose regulon positive regulatory protein